MTTHRPNSSISPSAAQSDEGQKSVTPANPTDNAKAPWIVKGFGRVRLLIKALLQTLSKFDSRESIRFSKGFYFRVPRLETTLVSIGLAEGGIINVDLSLEETKLIFRSIKSAMDECDVKTVTVGDLKWTTDARPKTHGPENITIRFRRLFEFSYYVVRREDVARALDEFSKRFGAI